MDGLFNNPVIIKLQEFGQKLGANKFVSALQGSMMGSMGFIMCGSVFQVACALLNSFAGVQATDPLYVVLYTPYNFTMGLIGLWITCQLAYGYARNKGCKSPIAVAVEATAFYVLACCYTVNGMMLDANVTFLGAAGMFVGFIVAWAVTEVDYFCQVKNVRIPMPDVCPPSLVNGINAVVPAVINASIWLLLSWGTTVVFSQDWLMNYGGGLYAYVNIASVLMSLLAAPLKTLISVPGMFIMNLFATFMWCFGIHGTLLLISVIMAPMMMVAAENAAIWEAAIAAGKTAAEAQYMLTFSPIALFGAIAICGGTGNTLPLCLFGLKAKSEQIRTVAKIGLVPGWFGINEPVTFGMPIMYNPILCIPYILNCQVITLITLLAYKMHIIFPGHVYIGALLPMGMSSALSTMRPIQFLWDYFCLIPAGLIWYPFFKAYDNQLYAKEQAEKAAEAA